MPLKEWNRIVIVIPNDPLNFIIIFIGNKITFTPEILFRNFSLVFTTGFIFLDNLYPLEANFSHTCFSKKTNVTITQSLPQLLQNEEQFCTKTTAFI